MLSRARTGKSFVIEWVDEIMSRIGGMPLPLVTNSTAIVSSWYEDSNIQLCVCKTFLTLFIIEFLIVVNGICYLNCWRHCRREGEKILSWYSDTSSKKTSIDPLVSSSMRSSLISSFKCLCRSSFNLQEPLFLKQRPCVLFCIQPIPFVASPSLVD